LETFDPILPDSPITFENWVSTINQPEWRKEELRSVYNSTYVNKKPVEILKDNVNKCNIKLKEVKAFIKDEFLTEYKYPRSIFARCDAFKVIAGPLFSAIEKKVFCKPWFIKYVPVMERPAAFAECFAGLSGPASQTDFTSYEAAFDSPMMELEGWFYSYMTSKLDPENRALMAIVTETLAGVNDVRYKFFRAFILARRMSGEMNTSLGNGLINLMLHWFLCDENGTTFNGKVEGDDGLFMHRDPSKAPTAAQYAALGFDIKLVKYERSSEASFCGMVYAPEEMINITDPYYVLSTFGWCDKKYNFSSRKKKMMLLRAKALSMIYQYPGCPILSSLACKLLEFTKSITITQQYIDTLDSYKREQMLSILSMAKKRSLEEVMAIKPGVYTRDLMYRLYGILPTVQELLEHQFLNLTISTDIVINLDFIGYLFPKVWSDNYKNFTTTVKQFRKRLMYTTHDAWMLSVVHQTKRGPAGFVPIWWDHV